MPDFSTLPREENLGDNFAKVDKYARIGGAGKLKYVTLRYLGVKDTCLPMAIVANCRILAELLLV